MIVMFFFYGKIDFACVLWMENDRFSSVIEIMIAFVLWLKD
jgi:hypothetical protein